MFKFYNKYILPWRLNKNMGNIEFSETRANAVSLAHGIVLEIGFGSGYNLPFYKNIDKLYAIDPSKELFNFAKDRILNVKFPVEYLESKAENIPLANETIDTVISTWSLCSVAETDKVLKEIKRVLKINGKFYFVEHGKSNKKINYIFQKILTPITKHFTGNCHLDREIDQLIKVSGLKIEKLNMMQEKGRPLMFSYQGIAVKK